MSKCLPEVKKKQKKPKIKSAVKIAIKHFPEHINFGCGFTQKFLPPSIFLIYWTACYTAMLELCIPTYWKCSNSFKLSQYATSFLYLLNFPLLRIYSFSHFPTTSLPSSQSSLLATTFEISLYFLYVSLMVLTPFDLYNLFTCLYSV